MLKTSQNENIWTQISFLKSLSWLKMTERFQDHVVFNFDGICLGKGILLGFVAVFLYNHLWPQPDFVITKWIKPFSLCMALCGSRVVFATEKVLHWCLAWTLLDFLPQHSWNTLHLTYLTSPMMEINYSSVTFVPRRSYHMYFHRMDYHGIIIISIQCLWLSIFNHFNQY